VQHPLLDRVRQCSTDPDQAALFFQTILSPVPQVRVKALEELWCAATVNRMFSETGTNFEAGKAAAMAALQKRNQKRKRGLCAALCGCFSAPISQRQEDSSCPPPTRVLEAEAVTDDGTQPQTVASSVRSSHDGELETHTMQSAAQQTPAQVSLTQKCVRKLKSACRRKLKPSSSASTQPGVEGRDNQQMIAGDANSPSAAVSCSDSSTEQKQAAVSKHSLQPGCVHVTVKAQSSEGCAVQQQPCHQQAESNEAELKPSIDRYHTYQFRLVLLSDVMCVDKQHLYHMSFKNLMRVSACVVATVTKCQVRSTYYADNTRNFRPVHVMSAWSLLSWQHLSLQLGDRVYLVSHRIQSRSALTRFVQRGRNLLKCARSKTPLKDEPAH